MGKKPSLQNHSILWLFCGPTTIFNLRILFGVDNLFLSQVEIITQDAHGRKLLFNHVYEKTIAQQGNNKGKAIHSAQANHGHAGKHRLDKSHANYIPGRVVSPRSAAGRASTGSTGHMQPKKQTKERKRANKTKK